MGDCVLMLDDTKNILCYLVEISTAAACEDPGPEEMEAAAREL